MAQLGRIQKVELRDYWKKEDKDFTPWLAKEENIQLLSETIGIDLEVIAQEQNVGPFRADILCKDVATDQYVLIENQLEMTDHTHLGQIMTYAAGLNAVTIIWIARKFDDEHRAALDWLNRITDTTFNFFGIEIGLVKIGDSLAAPIFDIVAQPNDWSKTVKESTKNSVNGELTDIKKAQLNYWNEFTDYARQTGKANFSLQKGLPQHWFNVSVGKSYFNISLTVNSQKNFIRVGLDVLGERAKDNFRFLQEQYEEESRKEISEKIEWDILEDRKQSYISVQTPYNFLDISTRKQQFEWLIETTNRFVTFFKPKVRDLQVL